MTGALAAASPAAAALDEPRPRVGLGFQSNKSLGDYERLAAAAESYGFDVLSVFGDLWFQPPIVALLAMARATRRVALGPACCSPFLTHPVEIAGQIAALDAASGGRAYVGLARGGWLGDLGIAQADAVEAIGEAALVVAALLTGDDAGVEGRRFSLPARARLRDGLARRRVPLLIGTWGRRLAALASARADEVKLGGSANPAMVRLMRLWIDSAVATAVERSGEDAGLADLLGGVGAAAAHRPEVGSSPAPRSRQRVDLVVGAVTVVDEDGAAARRRARREVAMYVEVVGKLDPTLELPDGLLEGIREHLVRGDADGAGALIPGELLSCFAFAGTPEEVTAHAATLVEAGADRIEFGTPHGLTDDGGIALIGRRVLPALRRLSATRR